MAFGRKQAAAFLLKFFIIYAVLQAILLFGPLQGLQNWVAAVEAGALGLPAQGNLVLVGSSVFVIASNCTGLMSSSVLAAIVFSLRKPELKKKLGLVIGGTAILFLLNLGRVYAVLLAAISFGQESAIALHIASWYAMAAAIVALWYWLSKRVAGTKAFAEML